MLKINYFWRTQTTSRLEIELGVWVSVCVFNSLNAGRCVMESKNHHQVAGRNLNRA